MSESIDKAFEDAQAQDLEGVLIVGLNKFGRVSLHSSVNNFAIMAWMLSMANYDLNVFQRQPPKEDVEESSEEDKK